MREHFLKNGLASFASNLPSGFLESLSVEDNG